MNEAHFKRQYSRLTEIFDVKFLPKTYRGTLFNSVKRLSNEEFTAAVDLVIETFVPNASCRFPMPAHFFQAAREWARSTGAVPPPQEDDESARFQETQQRTIQIVELMKRLPHTQYERIVQQAKREIDSTCPQWMYVHCPDVITLAVKGRMIEIFCHETGHPLPSTDPGEVCPEMRREPHGA